MCYKSVGYFIEPLAVFQDFYEMIISEMERRREKGDFLSEEERARVLFWIKFCLYLIIEVICDIIWRLIIEEEH